MITFRHAIPSDLLGLWQIEQREYPEFIRSKSFEEFDLAMAQRTVFTILDDAYLIGCMSFQDTGATDATLHGFILREKHGVWLRREIISGILSFPFRSMGKHRISVPLICGSMEWMEKFLLRMGFKREGVIRKALLRDDKLFDITLLGLTSEDMRF